MYFFFFTWLETWLLNKILSPRVDDFNSRALRTTENIKWVKRVTNKVLRSYICQPQTIDALYSLAMSFTYHLTSWQQSSSFSTKGYKLQSASRQASYPLKRPQRTEFLWRIQSFCLKTDSNGKSWHTWSVLRIGTGWLRPPGGHNDNGFT